MSPKEIFHDDVIVSYSQIMIYDRSIQLPGCEWTEAHSNQGFARRKGTLCCGTLIEYGKGDATVYMGNLDDLEKYERVIETPFYSKTGEVEMAAPDEYPVTRRFQICSGNYSLIVAQRYVDEEMVKIDLYFKGVETPLEKSSILLRDDALNPRDLLIEDAEVPGN